MSTSLEELLTIFVSLLELSKINSRNGWTSVSHSIRRKTQLHENNNKIKIAVLGSFIPGLAEGIIVLFC
jgi:hypothetical protein